MTKTTSWSFRSDDGQAGRLPPDMAFGTDVELTLVRCGDVTIYPTRTPPKAMVDRLAALPRPASVEIRDDGPIDDPTLPGRTSC